MKYLKRFNEDSDIKDRIEYIKNISTDISDIIKLDVYDGSDLEDDSPNRWNIKGNLRQHISEYKDKIRRQDRRSDYIFIYIHEDLSKEKKVYINGEFMHNTKQLKDYIEFIQSLGIIPYNVYGGVNFTIIEINKKELEKIHL